MSLNNLQTVFITLFLTGFLLISCQQKEILTDEKHNVIIIFTDDQGYQDVGCFGSPLIKTPNLDGLAKEGIMLTDFHAAQPVCSASRAGLLTGCYPNRIGIHNALMPNSPIGLNPDETTIAEMLKENGYNTAIFGKWHLGDNEKFMPNKHGFDEYVGIPYSNDMWPHHPGQGKFFDFDPLPLYENEKIIDTLSEQSHLTTLLTERSINFIKANKNSPFFLYLAHPQPHVPLFVSDKFKGKSERGLYGDVIMEIDWSVGEIIKTLQEEGLDDNTLVIFTSDNGPWLNYGEHSGNALPFREGKGTSFEGGHREPCIVYFPKKLKGGRSIDIPMMNIDILPTIAEITDAKLPKKTIDGKSVWNIWTGASNESPHEAYFHYYHVNELEAVRYKNWKLYFPHQYRTLNGRPGGKNGWPVPYDHIKLDSIELYNLAADISETNNVASQHPEIVSKITALADSMRYKLGDNLKGIEGAENREPGKVIED
jgi:arylsulfatase